MEAKPTKDQSRFQVEFPRIFNRACILEERTTKSVNLLGGLPEGAENSKEIPLLSITEKGLREAATGQISKKGNYKRGRIFSRCVLSLLKKDPRKLLDIPAAMYQRRIIKETVSFFKEFF